LHPTKKLKKKIVQYVVVEMVNLLNIHYVLFCKGRTFRGFLALRGNKKIKFNTFASVLRATGDFEYC
jgi:hypothetical protein